jgi:hypothetical protein
MAGKAGIPHARNPRKKGVKAMELQELASLAFGLVAASLGFFIRRLIRELDTLRSDFEAMDQAREKESARIRDTYVKYEDFVRLQTGIDGKLSQIYELLAGGRK